MRVGVDTGGTFTDVVTEQGVVRKLPSTPADPSRAVLDACDVLVRAGRSVAVLAHGTTVATNALLERRLGRVALVTTRGFADVIEIARQARPSLYDAHVDRPTPLVPRPLRFEVGGRLDAHGHELEPFDGAVPDVGAVDAVAVCLLHADLDPSHERAVAGVLHAARSRGRVLARGVARVPRVRAARHHDRRRVAPRGVRAVPRQPRSGRRRRAGHDLRRWIGGAHRGGRAPGAAVVVGPGRWRARRGRDRAARAASPTRSRSTWAAPAPTCAWCRAAFRHPRPRGTSPASPCGCRRWRSTPSGPVAVRWRAWIRAVRSQSDPRAPAPNRDPPATDAAAPRRPSPTPTWCWAASRRATELPGLGRLDVAAARAALDRAGVTAEGVVAVVDAAMARAVRVVTVEYGVDPRAVALLAFGGAGPLHACAVADELGHRNRGGAAPRRRVLRARHPLRTGAARDRRVVADSCVPRRPRRSARRIGRACAPRSCPGVTWTNGSTAGTRVRATRSW